MPFVSHGPPGVGPYRAVASCGQSEVPNIGPLTLITGSMQVKILPPSFDTSIELLKGVVLNRLADTLHKGKVVREVVNARKLWSKHLPNLEEMIDIGA